MGEDFLYKPNRFEVIEGSPDELEEAPLVDAPEEIGD